MTNTKKTPVRSVELACLFSFCVEIEHRTSNQTLFPSVRKSGYPGRFILAHVPQCQKMMPYCDLTVCQDLLECTVLLLSAIYCIWCLGHNRQYIILALREESRHVQILLRFSGDVCRFVFAFSVSWLLSLSLVILYCIFLLLSTNSTKRPKPTMDWSYWFILFLSIVA